MSLRCNGLIKIAADFQKQQAAEKMQVPKWWQAAGHVVAGRGQWVPRTASPKQGQHIRPRGRSLKVAGPLQHPGGESCDRGGPETDG